MKEYRVLHFSQTEIGKLEDQLNDAAIHGYVFKAVHVDQSYRTLVVMEKEAEDPFVAPAKIVGRKPKTAE